MPKLKCKGYKPGMQFKYAHFKRDGIYLRVAKLSPDCVRCFTSLDNDITEDIKLCDAGWLQEILTGSCPVGTVLLGELHVPGQPASYVKSAIAQGEAVYFAVFAIHNWNVSIPLDIIEHQVLEWGLDFCPFLKLSASTDIEYAMNQVMGKVIPDIEGLVFKNGNLENWHKWKPVKTIDCVVTATKDGNKKYIGLLGSLIVSIFEPCPKCGGEEFPVQCARCNSVGSLYHEIANVSGMDEVTRVDLSGDQNACIGRVVEVAYQYVGAKGRLRHPRFVRFRDDKLPSQCTLDQDDDLVAHIKKVS